MKEIVSVGQIMREHGHTNIAQLEFIRQLNIKPVFSKPYGAGYSHFVSAEDGEKIRLHLSDRKKRRNKAHKPSAKTPVQIHFDNIETKERFWSRVKHAFQVLAGK